MKKRIKNKKGFSLVEVLITLLVLSFGIVGVSSLMIASIKNSRDAKNQIIAAQLAQEGIELLRNLKDNNPGFNSAGTEVADGENYRIGIIDDYVTFRASNNAGSDKKLYLAGAGVVPAFYKGFYFHSVNPAVNTKFARKVKVQNDSVNKNVKVTTLVTWNGSGSFPGVCNVQNRCVSVDAVLPD